MIHLKWEKKITPLENGSANYKVQIKFQLINNLSYCRHILHINRTIKGLVLSILYLNKHIVDYRMTNFRVIDAGVVQRAIKQIFDILEA